MTVAREIAAERLVFVDEMDTNIFLCPLYAWSPRGERAHCFVSRNRGLNTMLLASMTVEGIAPCLSVEGTTTGGIVFEAYIERVLQGNGRIEVEAVVLAMTDGTGRYRNTRRSDLRILG